MSTRSRRIMFIVFIVGTAGSGKTLLASAFSGWARMEKQKVSVVNLDPGAIDLPYSPDVDVRDHVNLEALMREYRLGPNGALLMAADLVAQEVEALTSELANLNADLVIVDTPGQIELFAFRASGPYIVNGLTKEPKALVYLFDSVFSLNPTNYVSNLFLSAAIYNRFLIPQIHVLSKCDLPPLNRVESIVNWSEVPETLEEAIEEQLKGTNRLLNREIMRAVYDLELGFRLIPVSAKTNEGLIDLNITLERVFSGGEQFTH